MSKSRIPTWKITVCAREAMRVKSRPLSRSVPVDVAADDLEFLRVDTDRSFFAMLQGLPPQQRTVLVLRYFLDLDDVRIARSLGISRGTVRSHAALGLQRLRESEEGGR